MHSTTSHIQMVPRAASLPPARSAAHEAGKGRAIAAATAAAIRQSSELQAAGERARMTELHDRQQIARSSFEIGEQKGYVQGQTHGWWQGAVGGALIACIAVWLTPLAQRAVNAMTALF